MVIVPQEKKEKRIETMDKINRALSRKNKISLRELAVPVPGSGQTVHMKAIFSYGEIDRAMAPSRIPLRSNPEVVSDGLQ